jgi:hypothetical protein
MEHVLIKMVLVIIILDMGKNVLQIVKVSTKNASFVIEKENVLNVLIVLIMEIIVQNIALIAQIMNAKLMENVLMKI